MATHTIIAELHDIDTNSWTMHEVNWLCDIACTNSQVRAILVDLDVCQFYKSIIDKGNQDEINVQQIKDLL